MSQNVNLHSTMRGIHIVRVPEDQDQNVYYWGEVYSAVNTDENPWLHYPWFRDNFRIWAELLPRPSETQEGLVAYFQNVEKRARHIRTPIKPGRFLQKFFGHILDQEQIKEHALEWSNAHAVRPVTITQDAAEIESVYKSAHHGSCMHFPYDDYDGSVHPARVYAGPDLGIAYIGDADESEGRTLVWPDKKIYLGKAYGDTDRLFGALDAAGYSEGSNSDFTGARIRRIRHGTRYFVVPYSDTHSHAKDEGDYLVLSNYGSVDMRQTEGISGPTLVCDDCDESMDEDDSNTIVNGNRVCDGCLDCNYFRCEIEDEYYHNTELAPTPEEYSVSNHGARNDRKWFRCEFTEMYYPHADYTEVELPNGYTCVESYAKEHGFYCVIDETWSLEMDDEIKLSDGTSIDTNSISAEDLPQWLIDKNVVRIDPVHPDQLQLQLSEAA
ncbi:hypothetical protein [Rhizobium arsenicireducens]